MLFKTLSLLLLTAVVSADLAWWQKTVFYQIYPRSYQDSDNNGIGDIQGIIQHVNYLKDLGVGGIWMNPIYDSPLKDFGYDISNFTSIDTTFGTFKDFSDLVNELHESGMYILVDLVPNHSSNEHPWFQKSESNDPEYKDYYVWHDGSGFFKWFGKGNVPNNWRSVMGGSAWQYSEKRKQYYYHAFLKEQPDLNYRNPKVVQAMKDVLKFWLDLGVDGFRVDAVPYLVEDASFKNNGPCNPPSDNCVDSRYTQNQPETYEVLAQFKEFLQNYSNPNFPGEKIMVTEVYADLKTIQNYFVYENKKTSTMPFNFQLINLNMETNGTNIKSMVDDWFNNLIEGGWSNWVTGNHDQNRVGHKVGLPMTDGMNMLVLLLPGTGFTYYGEELGMDDTYIDCFQMQDTQAIRQANGDCGKMESISRDPERTPMQWNTSRYAGFSEANPWLPVNPNYFEENVEVQTSNKKSHYNIYKTLMSLRSEMVDCKNMTTYAPADGWVFGFKRTDCNTSKNYLVLVNFNNDVSAVSMDEFGYGINWYVSVSSKLSALDPGEIISANIFFMQPKESVVLTDSSV